MTDETPWWALSRYDWAVLAQQQIESDKLYGRITPAWIIELSLEA